MNIAVVACLHGNEPYGVLVAKQANLPWFIGNPEALLRGERYVEEDLNRCFPGCQSGSYEARRAHQLLRELKHFDAVLDLHSTSKKCPLFGMVTSLDDDTIGLARKLCLERIVYFPKKLRSTTALIDCVPGISLEIGPHDAPSNVGTVLNKINNVTGAKGVVPTMYEVRDVVRKEAENIVIQNFDEVQKGDILATGSNTQRAKKSFTAVLVDEAAYEDVLCLATTKMW